MTRTALVLVLTTAALQAGDWSAPVEIHHDTTKCVSYQAKIAGSHLIVEATHEPGWHTNAMDNEKRATEKLAGKKALGVDRSTEITTASGVKIEGPWMQTAPKDFSKPELQWFTWGFEGKALFAAKVEAAGSAPVRINVQGQACSAAMCKNIDVEIAVPVSGASAPGVDLKALIPVRQ